MPHPTLLAHTTHTTHMCVVLTHMGTPHPDLVKSMLKVQQAEKEAKTKEGSGPWEEKKRKCIMM